MKLSSLLILVSLPAAAQKPPNWFLDKVGLESDDASLARALSGCAALIGHATALRDASMCHEDNECTVYEPFRSKAPGSAFTCQPILAALTKRYKEVEASAWMGCGHATIYRSDPCELRTVCRSTQCEFAPAYCEWLGWICPSPWQFTFLYFAEYQYSRRSQRGVEGGR